MEFGVRNAETGRGRQAEFHISAFQLPHSKVLETYNYNIPHDFYYILVGPNTSYDYEDVPRGDERVDAHECGNLLQN